MSAATAHARLGALFLSFVFGLVAMALAIHAFVKSHDQKALLRSDVPAGATVSVDTNDVLDSGIVVAVVCALVALVSLLSLLHALCVRVRVAKTSVGRLHARALPLASGTALAFLSVWLFATLVPFTDFIANRQAKVSASIGDMVLSPAEIQAFEDALGLTGVYHKLSYLVTSTVLPWIALLFSTLASALSFVCARTTTTTMTPTAYESSKAQMAEM